MSAGCGTKAVNLPSSWRARVGHRWWWLMTFHSFLLPPNNAPLCARSGLYHQNILACFSRAQIPPLLAGPYSFFLLSHCLVVVPERKTITRMKHNVHIKAHTRANSFDLISDLSAIGRLISATLDPPYVWWNSFFYLAVA